MKVEWLNKEGNDDKLETSYRLSRSFLLTDDNPIKTKNGTFGAPAIDLQIIPSFTRNEKKVADTKYSANEKVLKIIFDRYKTVLNKESFPFIKVNYKPFGDYLKKMGFKEVPGNDGIYGNEHAFINPDRMTLEYKKLKKEDTKPYQQSSYRGYPTERERNLTQSKYRQKELSKGMQSKAIKNRKK